MIEKEIAMKIFPYRFNSKTSKTSKTSKHSKAPKLPWMLNTSILTVFAMLCFLHTSLGQDTQAQRGTPIEFETTAEIKNMDPAAATSGAYYYSNADDDPVAAPTVGEDSGIKFIEISSIRGNSKTVASTRSHLTRWVQIPPTSPERIKVNFKTRVSKNERYDWAAKGKEGTIRRVVTFSIDFVRPDGLEGGGIKLSTKTLTKELDKWVNHSEVISIPRGARYMKISATTSGGYNLALGDWRIE